jgi:biotin transport system substrate-specific component
LSTLTTRNIALGALFAALIAVGAFVTIPMFGSVPFTLQVLFVLLAGLVLGPRLGALSVIVYLLVGLVAPVYAGSTSGLGHLFGPSGGYLFGFVVAAAVAGLISRHARRGSVPGLVLAVLAVLAGLAGLVPMYAIGATWLAWQLHTTSYHIVIWGGILQFLPFDVIKAVAAGLAVSALASLPVGLPVLREPQ